MRYQLAPAELDGELVWIVFDTAIDFVIGEFYEKEEALKYISLRMSQEPVHRV